MFDIGALAAHKGLVRVGFELECWKNNYGNNSSKVTSASQRTPFVVTDGHF
ncbi:hypothetical protein ACFQAT_09455 [Undibacterium arcticum]|uniref:Uncharacterized protein n=1 Tax=Undibacterium arcticum TaxID=1762892 RepID=A0ABV7F1U9_9BURK